MNHFFGLRKFSDFVVLPHSIFALPFALSAFVLALAVPGAPPLRHSLLVTSLLVLVAIISARTAAMAFNRLVDADIDRKNPRTATREIPRGEISKRQAALLTGGASLLFILSAALLGFHCLVLSPFVLLVLLGYSFTKRFTSYSHLVLGLALALAPGGAWWVVRPEINAIPLLMMAGVVLWVGGFDIMYSCQDTLFDRAHGIFSIPAQFGTERALRISLLLHCVAAACFCAVGVWANLGALYFGILLVLTLVLLYQHRLVTPVDFSRVNRAFFTFNGIVSLGYLIAVVLAAANYPAIGS